MVRLERDEETHVAAIPGITKPGDVGSQMTIGSYVAANPDGSECCAAR